MTSSISLCIVVHGSTLYVFVNNVLCIHSPLVTLSLGGFDDVEQLRSGFQSSHRLDPASGEVGENRRPEQVIFGLFVFFFSPSSSVSHFLSLSSSNCSLWKKVEVSGPLALSHKQNGSIALALIQSDPRVYWLLFNTVTTATVNWLRN